MVEIYKHLDRLEVFDHTVATPVVLTDGHSTRLEPIFLRYCLNEVHRWLTVLGVPYQTNIWQWLDGSQGFGALKHFLRRVLAMLVRYKMRMGMTVSLAKTNIVPVLRRAIAESLEKTPSVRKCIAVRGWNPLNSATLTIDCIRRTAPSENSSEEQSGEAQVAQEVAALLPRLNTTAGVVGRTFDVIRQHALRNEASELERQTQLAAVRSVQPWLKHAVSLQASLFVMGSMLWMMPYLQLLKHESTEGITRRQRNDIMLPSIC